MHPEGYAVTAETEMSKRESASTISSQTALKQRSSSPTDLALAKLTVRITDLADAIISLEEGLEPVLSEPYERPTAAETEEDIPGNSKIVRAVAHNSDILRRLTERVNEIKFRLEV